MGSTHVRIGPEDGVLVGQALQRKRRGEVRAGQRGQRVQVRLRRREPADAARYTHHDGLLVHCAREYINKQIST